MPSLFSQKIFAFFFAVLAAPFPPFFPCTTRIPLHDTDAKQYSTRGPVQDGETKGHGDDTQACRPTSYRSIGGLNDGENVIQDATCRRCVRQACADGCAFASLVSSLYFLKLSHNDFLLNDENL